MLGTFQLGTNELGTTTDDGSFAHFQAQVSVTKPIVNFQAQVLITRVSTNQYTQAQASLLVPGVVVRTNQTFTSGNDIDGITFGWTATAGRILILIASNTDGFSPTAVPTGFTELWRVQRGGLSSNTLVYAKVAAGGETAINGIIWSEQDSHARFYAIFEFEGAVWPPASTASTSPPAVTIPGNTPGLILGIWANAPQTGTGTPGSGWTELIDTLTNGTYPHMYVEEKSFPAGTGAVTPTASFTTGYDFPIGGTVALSGNALRYKIFTQAQAKINAFDVTKCTQAQAQIGHIRNFQAQAQIKVYDVTKCTQAQTKIKAFDVNNHTQAQVFIAASLAYTQAQTHILVLNVKGYWQALAEVGHQRFTQAQAQINAFDVNQYTQAQARIVQTYTMSWQALSAIKHSGEWQAQALIVRTENAYLQAAAVIKHSGEWQAQAKINAFNVNGHWQANANIKATSRVVGNARVFITKTKGMGQAQAHILSLGRSRGYGQARVFMGPRKRHGLARVFIVYRRQAFFNANARIEYYLTNIGNWQANSSIELINRGNWQANALIRKDFAFFKAQAAIVTTVNMSWQAQALIDDRFAMGLTLALIVRTVNVHMQARVRMRTTYTPSGQVQALIRIRGRASWQALALIRNERNAFGQAQVFVGFFKRMQAQARILGVNVPKVGQAEAYILADTSITVSPTSNASSYLVRFGRRNVPGYAQHESLDSVMDIVEYKAPYRDFTLAQYKGLINKVIMLDMRLWETNYYLCKIQLAKAATILRSIKGFSDLYIQNYAKHYSALALSITAQKSVGQSTMLDYTIEFEAKPWLISNATYTITGTGLVDTGSRTINDGGWTPTRVTVSGTDVTITGYTDDAATGTIEIEGSCTDLIVDTELFTATENGANKNSIMINKDYGLYVGPGKTYFQIDGATSCVITYQNRWYI